MKFNTANQLERKAAFSYFTTLSNKKSIVEIKKVRQKRTLAQNRYLHLLIGYFGVHFGYTMEEAKVIYKQINNKLYRYEKKGRVFYRSSAKLSTEEMTKSIDTFRQVSAEHGCELPLATDQEWLMQIENEIERSGIYL